ncbi:MAG: ATP-dependent helicase HrpB [Proteobacteria bacterium]|nr:ATP-dependent helicase HrpB [Pseudomonadota bacterium]
MKISLLSALFTGSISVSQLPIGVISRKGGNPDTNHPDNAGGALPLPQLPIHHIIGDLKSALDKGSAVLSAPPGSGKTTIVPLALLDEPWLLGKKVLVLEPRRLAARAAATRMASLLGERIGQTVGYQIRFDRQISEITRIEVLTEGILTRRLQNDPGLSGVGIIIFDEFHERSIHADLALALCIDLCQIREDLRILVMSATLAASELATILGNVPVITGEGQSYEVQIEYLARPTQARMSATTASGVRRVVAEMRGDILVFLPGTGEIKEVHRQLMNDPACRGMLISPLFGDLSQKEQDQAILPDPGGRRRVILATSIAETSLTIEGITCVVDSGWSRRLQFVASNGLSRLTTVRVSRAAAAQRAGRAGRLGPGYCLRLWTKDEDYGLVAFHPPEIVAVDLAGLALELALWGVADPQELRWLDPPRFGPYQQALELLSSLGAINATGRITEIGRELAALPIHPRLGHMLLMAKRQGNGQLACDLAAILSERDLVGRDAMFPSADLRIRLHLLEIWRKNGSDAVRSEGGDPDICSRIDRDSRRWQKQIGCSNGSQHCEAGGNLLVFAYPDRLARRRPGQRERYLLAGGRGAFLPPADPLTASEYLVVPKMDAGRTEGRIFLAEPVELSDLQHHHPHLFSVTKEVYWDDSTARVVAMRQLSVGKIVVEEQPLTDIESEEITVAMLAGIRRMGLVCLPWDGESRQLQARIQCLRTWQPEMDWPDLGNDRLLDDLQWLVPYLSGISRAEQLKQLNIQEIFTTMLGWEKRQKLERDAPANLIVASGSKIRIEYRIDEPPLLAVRIQEMFGSSATPTICGGRIGLLLHLLSPARRPIQVTSDLAGFWQRGYGEVKKELKGRYPKHFWPDDPLTAEAVRGVKRKAGR